MFLWTGRVGHPLGNASRVNEILVLCWSKVSAKSNTGQTWARVSVTSLGFAVLLDRI